MTTGISPWPPIQWLAKCNLIASKPCLECSWSYLDDAYNQINDNSPVWDYAAWLGRFSIVVLQRIPVIGKIMELAKRLFGMSNDLCQSAAATFPPPVHPSIVTKEEIVQIKGSKDFSSLVSKHVYIQYLNSPGEICQINRIVSQDKIEISLCKEEAPTLEHYYNTVDDSRLVANLNLCKYDLEDNPKVVYDKEGQVLSLATFTELETLAY